MAIMFHGDKMRVAREELGLSLDDLKDVTGISKAYLSQLESGKRKDPSLEYIGKIADALRLPPVYFVLDNSMLFTQILPEELRANKKLMNFLLSGKNLPWVALAKDASEGDVPIDLLKRLIKEMKKKRK
jgi:transcriptional regulator with XRE-family HTH domain